MREQIHTAPLIDRVGPSAGRRTIAKHRPIQSTSPSAAGFSQPTQKLRGHSRPPGPCLDRKFDPVADPLSLPPAVTPPLADQFALARAGDEASRPHHPA